MVVHLNCRYSSWTGCIRSGQLTWYQTIWMNGRRLILKFRGMPFCADETFSVTVNVFFGIYHFTFAGI